MTDSEESEPEPQPKEAGEALPVPSQPPSRPQPVHPLPSPVPQSEADSDVELPSVQGEDATQVTPKSRPLPQNREFESPGTLPTQTPIVLSPTNGRSARKRRRTEDEEEEIGTAAEIHHSSHHGVQPTQDTSQPQTSPRHEFIIRRKRIRH